MDQHPEIRDAYLAAASRRTRRAGADTITMMRPMRQSLIRMNVLLLVTANLIVVFFAGTNVADDAARLPAGEDVEATNERRPSALETRSAETFFENEIRPLIASRCEKCHGAGIVTSAALERSRERHDGRFRSRGRNRGRRRFAGGREWRRCKRGIPREGCGRDPTLRRIP